LLEPLGLWLIHLPGFVAGEKGKRNHQRGAASKPRKRLLPTGNSGMV
jgi:hypothetical protein